MRSMKDIIDDMYSRECFEVDRSFLQGYDVVYKMLYNRFGVFGLDYDTKKYIYVLYQGLSDVEFIIKPYILDEDLLFFFGYCGGFHVDKGHYHFMFFGIGPMMDEWYADITGEDTYNSHFCGMLNIASMSLNSEDAIETVEFFFDLARGNVVGVKQNSDISITNIMKDMNRYTQYWKVFSESFTGFLELISINDGVVRY